MRISIFIGGVLSSREMDERMDVQVRKGTRTWGWRRGQSRDEDYEAAVLCAS